VPTDGTNSWQKPQLVGGGPLGGVGDDIPARRVELPRVKRQPHRVASRLTAPVVATVIVDGDRHPETGPVPAAET